MNHLYESFVNGRRTILAKTLNPVREVLHPARGQGRFETDTHGTQKRVGRRKTPEEIPTPTNRETSTIKPGYPVVEDVGVPSKNKQRRVLYRRTSSSFPHVSTPAYPKITANEGSRESWRRGTEHTSEVYRTLFPFWVPPRLLDLRPQSRKSNSGHGGPTELTHGRLIPSLTLKVFYLHSGRNCILAHD